MEKRKDLVEEYGAKYHDLTWTPPVKLLQVRDGVLGGGCRA